MAVPNPAAAKSKGAARRERCVAFEPSPFDDLVVRVAVVRPREEKYGAYTIGSAKDVAELFKNFVHEPQECMYILSLDSRHKVLGITEVARGGLAMSTTDPRVVFLAPILLQAAAVVLVHNHPSGDPGYSPADQALTELSAKGCDILGFRLLDHVVIGDEGKYFSFADAGLL